MKRILFLLIASVSSCLRGADSDAPVRLLVCNFQAPPGVSERLGADLARTVAGDLSALPSFVPVAAAALHGAPPQPDFSADPAEVAGYATQVRARWGIAAVVNGRVLFAGNKATLVAKVTESATGRVYGETVQGDGPVPLRSLAADISLKIGQIVLGWSGRGADWAPARLAPRPHGLTLAQETLWLDGREAKSGTDISLEPGVHDLEMSYTRGKQSTHAQFTIKAAPGVRYEVAAAESAPNSLRLWVADTASNIAVTSVISRQWVNGPDDPIQADGSYLLPGPRFGSAVVTDGKAIYIVGGRRGGSVHMILTDIVRFDLQTRRCTVLTNDLTRRAFLGAAWADGRIYIAGGASFNSTLRTMEIYDIAANRLTPGPSLPDQRQGFAMVRVGPKLYVMGGSIAPPNSTDEVDIFDLAHQTWTKGPPMLRGAEGHAVVAAGRIIFPGGFRGEQRYYQGREMATVQAFDLDSQRWSFLPAMSQELGGGAVAVLDGRIFMIGAYVDADRALAYDLTDGSSHFFRTGEQAQNATAIAVNDRIYVVGGKDPSEYHDLSSSNIVSYAENPNWNSAAGIGQPIR